MGFILGGATRAARLIVWWNSYAFDTVGFSEWLTVLRNEILQNTLDKIEREKQG